MGNLFIFNFNYIRMDFRHFIISLLIISGSLLIVSHIIGEIGDFFALNMPESNRNWGKMNYSINSAEANVIILGSSKASHNYNSILMSDKLGISVYNAGGDGRGLTYHACILNSICKRMSPKFVILDALPGDLSGNINDRVNMLFPYFNIDPFIREMIVKAIPKTKYFGYLSIYRYNSILPSIFRAYSEEVQNTYGFMPMPSGQDNRPLEILYSDYPTQIDPVSLAALDSIVSISLRVNATIVVVTSPELIISKNKSQIYNYCKERGILFIDNSNLEHINSDFSLFKDYLHLNSLGADVYTKYFINQIDSLINNEVVD